jgi:phosphatidate cytidylyltransferase
MLLGAAWVPHWAGAEVHWAAGLGLTGLALAVCMLLLLAEEARRYTTPGSSMETLGAHLLVIAYAGLLLAVTAQLRWVIGSQGGYLALGLLVVVTKMGDTSAYTVGRLFGKRKMAPLLSPGKTWAGALGAVVGAGLSGWAWLHFATPRFNPAWSAGPWYWCVLAGVVIGIAGMVGDLCESLIKRDMGQKDAAALMPGFGGLLDLLDSVLYAGPVAYVLWLVLPLRVVNGQ